MEEIKKELIIITGMSGAGKSEVINFFEDREYFCTLPLTVKNQYDLEHTLENS